MNPKVRTVQATINSILSKRFDVDVKTTGASRTDKGVHSTGQVIHFDLEDFIDTEQLQYTANRLLPTDLKICDISLVYNHSWVAKTVPAGKIFHATGSATGKRDVYRFYNGKMMDPIQARYCAHIRQVIKTIIKLIKIISLLFSTL